MVFVLDVSVAGQCCEDQILFFVFKEYLYLQHVHCHVLMSQITVFNFCFLAR